MLSEARIISFVGTSAPERAKDFYLTKLGLQLVASEVSALVFDSNGTMLRVSIVPEFEPRPLTVLGWEVADIEAEIDLLTERGVRLERFEGLEQDGRAIATFPDGTRVAWFRDPDGNLLSLTEF